MKTLLALIASLCLCANLFSQDNINPVIEKLRVVYKPVPTASITPIVSGVPDIKVKAKMIITIKPDAEASVIYVKVSSQQTNAVVYQVNYTVNSAVITGDEGIVLYKKENNTIEINNPSAVSLKPYVYELYTENAQGTKSTTYSITQ